MGRLALTNVAMTLAPSAKERYVSRAAKARPSSPHTREAGLSR